jgi:hypothetical protein
LKAVSKEKLAFLEFIIQTRVQDQTATTTSDVTRSPSLDTPVTSTDQTQQFMEDESEDEHSDRLDEIRGLAYLYRTTKMKEEDEDEFDRDGNADALFQDFDEGDMSADNPKGQKDAAFRPQDLVEYDSDGKQVPFYPFKEPEMFKCPFEAIGQCDKKLKLKNARSVVLHVQLQHPGQIIDTYETNPFEDGTKKVPCPKLCDRLFSSHHAANGHAKNPTHCTRPEVETVSLPVSME